MTDPEDGTIDCSRVTLQYYLGHDQHAHPCSPIPGAPAPCRRRWPPVTALTPTCSPCSRPPTPMMVGSAAPAR
ncbi:hypothetical protein ACFQZ4_49905 [Catellatospora coxensis]